MSKLKAGGQMDTQARNIAARIKILKLFRETTSEPSVQRIREFGRAVSQYLEEFVSSDNERAAFVLDLIKRSEKSHEDIGAAKKLVEELLKVIMRIRKSVKG